MLHKDFEHRRRRPQRRPTLEYRREKGQHFADRELHSARPLIKHQFPVGQC